MLPGCRRPLKVSPEYPRSHIEAAAVVAEPSRREKQWLVVDEELNDRRVRRCHNRLAHLRQPVGVLGVDYRPRLVQPADERSGL